jgi:hypothetical protein
LSLLSRARAAYVDHPTDARLRAYLNVKARAGIYDKRMLRYYGVPPIANRGCRKAICRAYAAGLVPTATTNGTHAATSYHKLGKAVDFGLRRTLIATLKGAERLVTFQRKEMWRRDHGRIHPVELLGPTNSIAVLRGHKTALREGTPLEQQHDNHCHEAYEA